MLLLFSLCGVAILYLYGSVVVVGELAAADCLAWILGLELLSLFVVCCDEEIKRGRRDIYVGVVTSGVGRESLGGGL
jgi:hypothetical protein